MNSDKKRHLEKSMFMRFKSLLAEFPEGDIEFVDKPDIVIHGKKKIGIELTQIFKDQHLKRGSLYKAKETFHINLLDNILNKMLEANFPNCSFAIHLNDEHYIEGMDARKIGQACFNELLISEREITPNIYLELENEGGMHEIIDAISISTYGSLNEINYVQTRSAFGIPLSIQFVQHILDKKEKAKSDFILCDEFWLVIKEGDGEGDYFGELNLNIGDLVTTFDKLYLLRRRNNELVELK